MSHSSNLNDKIKELAKESDLSKRQIDVLLCIQENIKRNQIPPTYREIGNELNICSTNAISDHVKALKKKGYLVNHDHSQNTSGKARGLILTKKAQSFFRNHFESFYTNPMLAFGDSFSTNAIQSISNSISNRISNRISNNFLLDQVSVHYDADGVDGEEGEQQSYIENLQQLQNIIQVPILGQVAAGNPILASEEYDETVHVDSSMTSGARNVFALRVKGDSMIEEGIHDGDIVIVRKQNTASDGNIVVALIEDEATVKYFFRERNRIRLQPANSTMNPIYLNPQQEACIQGVVTTVFRRYNS